MQRWGGGRQRFEGYWATQGPYGLNDVQAGDEGLMWGRGNDGAGGSISMNRPSHHMYKSPKQFL